MSRKVNSTIASDINNAPTTYDALKVSLYLIPPITKPVGMETVAKTVNTVTGSLKISHESRRLTTANPIIYVAPFEFETNEAKRKRGFLRSQNLKKKKRNNE